MTTNKTSQAVEAFHEVAEGGVLREGKVEISRTQFRAIGEKYWKMEEALQAIQVGDCHPSRYREGYTQCHAKSVGDCCCTCQEIWAKESLSFDPLSHE